MADLTFDTYLGKESAFDENHAPFMLAVVQGVEGISSPYAYDVTLYRNEKLPAPKISALINTRVTINIGQSNKIVMRRRGVIASMGMLGVSDIYDVVKENYFVYTARIIPAFKMMDNETRFRVFEKTDFITIFKEVIRDFPGIPGESYVDFAQISSDNPQIDYFVQFGESSFNFLCRLMAQYGIWYYFDHQQKAEDLANEKLVLAKKIANFSICDKSDMKIAIYRPGDNEVAQFVIGYNPSHHHVWSADFNQKDPTQPPEATEADVLNDYDLQPTEAKGTSRFRLEQFPPVFDKADILMRSEEAGVVVAQGQSRNRTFLAGRKFKISHDDTKAFMHGGDGKKTSDGEEYLITGLSFVAHDFSRGHPLGLGILNFLSDILVKPFDPFADGGTDNIANTTVQQTAALPGGVNVPGIVGTAVTPLLQGVAGNIKEVWSYTHPDYINNFSAITQIGGFWCCPLPTAKSPTVNGIHLAVVIGAKGTESDQLGGIYTDGNGQVRVRFAWQRVVPQPGFGDVTTPSADTDPLKSDRRTAWVRISENWAGRRYGGTFLPRIGDEVVVSFIDGDPNRPIITGRLYNDFAQHPFGRDKVMTHSGIKTQTLQDSSKAERYHLLRFDDDADHEQILLRAQGRFDMTAFNSTYQTTYGNLNVLVKQGKDKDGQTYGGKIIASNDSDYSLSIGGARSESVGDAYNLTVKKDWQLDLQANWAAMVKTQFSVNAPTIVLEASEKLSLKVGSSSVVLDATGVWIDGSLVQINGGGSPAATSNLTMKDPETPKTADAGDPANGPAKPASVAKVSPPATSNPHIAEAQHAPTAMSNSADGYVSDAIIILV